MTRRSPVPASPAFGVTARAAQFRDRIAIVVKAPPEAIFEALHNVTLRDMKWPGCSVSSVTSHRGWLAACRPPNRGVRS